MKKLIYINLFIDNDWDEKKLIDQIFPFKIDSSEAILKSYSHLGIFFGTLSDTALLDTAIDPDFFNYLEKHFGKLARPVLLSDFSLVKNSTDHLILVGVSPKEEAIFGQDWLHQKGYLTSKKYQSINSKDLLLSFLNTINFLFPHSSLVKFEDLLRNKEDQFPYCIKFLNSAGGRGVFKVEEDKKILEFLERQLEEDAESLILLKQEFLPIKKHFYTISHTDESLCKGFEIYYDDKANSRRHVKETSISGIRSTLAAKLGQELLKMNYSGPFGFDGLTTIDGTSYPAIDLNVRLDKSRVFHEILQRFDCTSKKVEFRRERFSLVSYNNFKEFYLDKLQVIENLSAINGNDFQLIVILCSNIFRPDREKTIGEITFLIIRNESAPESEFEKWLRQSYNILGINYDE